MERRAATNDAKGRLSYATLFCIALACSGCGLSQANRTPHATQNPKVLSIPSDGSKPVSPFVTDHSEFVDPTAIQFGEALNRPSAPVVMEWCSYSSPVPFRKATAVKFSFGVYNTLASNIKYLRIVWVYTRSAYNAAYLFNLKPHELRVFSAREDARFVPLTLNAHVPFLRPSYNLRCGAGPALTSQGTYLDFAPPFMVESQNH